MKDYRPKQTNKQTNKQTIKPLLFVKKTNCDGCILPTQFAAGSRHSFEKIPLPSKRIVGRAKPEGIANKVSIDERPPEVGSREEIGHWEVDTVIGKLAGKHAEPRAEKTIEILTPFSDKVKSLASDNGKEFAKFERIAECLGALFFFAHPYHSWERGTNENTNGLIRQYLPKSMGFEFLAQEDCQKIMDKLNNRPRKALGFRTPKEVFFSKDLHLSRL